jgi:hypothetical protein
MESHFASPSEPQNTSTSIELNVQSESIPYLASGGDRESTEVGMRPVARGVERQGSPPGNRKMEHSQCCLLL